MSPGQHLIAVCNPTAAIRLRAQGWHLRDTLSLVLPGPRTQTAFLFRRPLQGTVAEVAMAYGQGALNIDACRIRANLSEFFSATGKPRSGLGHAKGYGMGEGYGGYLANPPHSGGRWPPNLLLVHGPGCACMGTKELQATPSRWKFYGGKPKTSTVVYAQDAWTKQNLVTSGVCHDSAGVETVAAWRCEKGCPVALLDGQSGVRPVSGCAKSGRPSKSTSDGDQHTFGAGLGRQGALHNDSGGASRFFTQSTSFDQALRWLSNLLRG